MKKALFSITLTVLLFAVILSGCVEEKKDQDNQDKIEYKNIFINNNTTKRFYSIQEAIDSASDKDVVYVYNGTYFENLKINKSISLIGEDKNNTIIDGQQKGNVINITATWVNISGFNITNSGDAPDLRSGIYITNFLYEGNNTISNNRIINNRHGILLSNSEGNLILKNQIIENEINGIFYYSGNNHYNQINMNNISKNHRGIWLESGYYNEIMNNEIINNEKIGISCKEGWYNTIQNNNISTNRGTGFVFDESNNNKIIENIFYYNDFAVSCEGYDLKSRYNSNNIITNNIFLNNLRTINFRSNGKNNNFSNNYIENFHYKEYRDIWAYCMKIWGPSYIYNNTIIGIGQDCVLLESNYENSKFINNKITGYNGIILDSSADNNQIFNNKIYNCTGYGIKITDYCKNNSIYSNNLINNSNYFDEGNSSWYNVNIGNYWSEYEGIDNNNDGIGDSPYDIPDIDKKDMYPLISPVDI